MGIGFECDGKTPLSPIKQYQKEIEEIGKYDAAKEIKKATEVKDTKDILRDAQKVQPVENVKDDVKVTPTSVRIAETMRLLGLDK